MSEAMAALRTALITLFAESFGAVDQLSSEEQDALDAWNAVCEASATKGYPEPITMDDIEAEFI